MTVFSHSFFMKKTWYAKFWAPPERDGEREREGGEGKRKRKRRREIDIIARSYILTIFGSCPTEPLCQVADKVEEKVALRNTDDLVTDHHKQGEALGTGKAQPVSNGCAEVF